MSAPHIKRIADCIKLIEHHLDGELSVEAVARASGYSPYYFQRLFSRSLGLTLGTYIRRRSLGWAATDLSTTPKRIIEIAQDAGFESQEAFTRVFKEAFGKTPGQYRADKDLPILKSFPAFHEELLDHVTRYRELREPRFVERQGFWLAGMGCQSKRGDTQNISKDLWPRFMGRRHEIEKGKVKDNVNYGLLKLGGASDGPAYETFVYYAATEVMPGAPVPTGFEKIEIKAQRYAVFDHKGGMCTLSLSNRYIWGVWAMQSGYEIAESPDFEVYPSDFVPQSNEAMEIWIPIVSP